MSDKDEILRSVECLPDVAISTQGDSSTLRKNSVLIDSEVHSAWHTARLDAEVLLDLLRAGEARIRYRLRHRPPEGWRKPLSAWRERRAASVALDELESVAEQLRSLRDQAGGGP